MQAAQHDPSSLPDDATRSMNMDALAAIARVLPLGEPDKLCSALFESGELAAPLLASELERIEGALVRPLRTILDRGGKGFRGGILEACCTAVGGDFAPYADWTALTELLHVGSMIVDDVEDDAQTRRGGPACHLVHGRAAAINAGTFAYFVPQRMIQRSALPPSTKLALYEELLGLLRVAHVGQGLDILSLADSLCGGASLDELSAALDTIHRYKSGWAFRTFARMGAILGGAAPEQVEALGELLLLYGIAFQRVDDLLDVTGFLGGYKPRGGDVRAGKVTYPLLCALRRLPHTQRVELRQAFAEVRNDEPRVDRVLNMIVASGAVEAGFEETQRMTDSAWAALGDDVVDEAGRARLREFTALMIQRVY